jgi:prepilin-type N-terminal cleavage/methylation domain-containing protein
MNDATPSLRRFSPHLSRQRGLTMIELLAALTLTVLLACATLGIMRNLMHQAKESAVAAPPWIRRLRDTLTQELVEAEQVQRIPDGVILQGPLHPRPSVTDGSHHPLKIVWRVNQGRLVREETDLLTGGFRRQTVAIGIDRLDLAQQMNEADATCKLTLTGSALPKGLIISVSGAGGAK